MGYRIKTVAEILNVPRNTLLAWERRYAVVRPARQENGYREYSEADVTRLQALKQLINNGHRISEAISLLDASPQPVSEPTKLNVQTQVLNALLLMDHDSAVQIIQRNVSPSYARQLDTLYFPLLQEIGTRWTNGSLDIAQEHFISNFCRERMSAMLMSLAHGPRHGPRALCVVFPEDQHDLPLLGVAVKLALSGHRVLFLGTATPVDSLLTHIQRHQPQKICISATLPVTASAVLIFAHRLLAVSNGEIMFGGTGIPVEELEEIPRITWVKGAM